MRKYKRKKKVVPSLFISQELHKAIKKYSDKRTVTASCLLEHNGSKQSDLHDEDPKSLNELTMSSLLFPGRISLHTFFKLRLAVLQGISLSVLGFLGVEGVGKLLLDQEKECKFKFPP